MGKDAVPVVKQIAMARLVTDHLASLLQRPVGARVLHHVEVQPPASLFSVAASGAKSRREVQFTYYWVLGS